MFFWDCPGLAIFQFYILYKIRTSVKFGRFTNINYVTVYSIKKKKKKKKITALTQCNTVSLQGRGKLKRKCMRKQKK